MRFRPNSASPTPAACSLTRVTKAEKEDRKVRLRMIEDSGQAASTLAEACRLLLDPGLPDSALRVRIHAAIGRDALTQALNDINGLVHPPNDGFYSELEAEKGAVTRLLPTIQFDANPATQPLIQGLQWLLQRLMG